MQPKKPVITAVVVSISAVLTGLQFVFPTLLTTLQRSPAAISEHEWWRFVTPFFINRGGWAEISLNILTLIIVGTIAERLLSGRQWLLLYLLGGVVGECAGLAWKPIGAGTSVAMLGLVGGLAAWLLRRNASWPARLGGIALILVGVLLTALKNLHGPPLLVGVCTGAFLLRRPEEAKPTVIA